MKVRASPDVSNLPDLDQVKRFATIVLREITDVLNGQITFVDNIRQEIHSVTFDAADTDVSVSHGLGRVPTGVVVLGLTAAMIVYDGSTGNTVDAVYLRSSATGTARVMFI